MFGEVFICQFPFTSGAISKPRPALVPFELHQDTVICRATAVRRFGPLDILLVDWQQAGPARPSVARLDQLVTAEKTILYRRLGDLSARDEAVVRFAWNCPVKW